MKELIKSEWEFHKRQPELFVMWACYAWSLCRYIML